jgi:PKD repeat protein
MRIHRIASVLVVGAALIATSLVTGGGVRGIAPTATTVHFTASGDFSSSANAQAVLAGVDAINPDLHLALGDLSYGTTGQEQAWCDLVTQKVGAGFPFELISGNHESNGENGNINDFSACLPNQLPGVVGSYGRQYYVDVPEGAPLVRFVMISPGLPFSDGVWSYAAGTPRYNWTASAIDGARTANIPWVVVGMHMPCLSIGQYTCDPGADLLNLLVNKRVDLVLTGHDHVYQRTHQLALGAGCSALVPGAFSSGCIADSDPSMVKGAGTVFATVGTGGTAMYNINPADSEAGYFAAAQGLNSNPTWGSLDVSVTATQLTASFARAAGGTFTDSFTLGPPGGGGNQAPTASFTSACTDLACTFDGSASNDPDGTLQVFTWDFGDGAGGTGGTATHSYAAAGTYTVRLTVTDDGGASSTTTRLVTVTAPPPPPPPPPPPGSLASDTFDRTVTNGWGTAPTGGPWTVAGSSTLYGVGSGVGVIQLPAGNGGTTRLASVSSSATDLRLNVSIDKMPSSGSVYLSISGRRIATTGAYQSKVIISSTGKVTIAIVRVNASGGSEVVVQPAITVNGLTYTAGAKLAIRLRVTGSNPTLIESRTWLDGTTEPTTWQRSISDSTAGHQAAGGLAITGYLSGGVANAPVYLSVDDLTAQVP